MSVLIHWDCTGSSYLAVSCSEVTECPGIRDFEKVEEGIELMNVTESRVSSKVSEFEEIIHTSALGFRSKPICNGR